MNILVFGVKGSGKSTHAKYIAEKLDLPYVYTGDMFRELEKEDSVRGRKINKLMKKGILIPDDITITAFKEYLKKFDISKGVVLEGYPRTLVQVEALPIIFDLIINVTLPSDLILERLKLRGRYDDYTQAIKTSIQLFEKKTKPVLSYYRKKGVDVVKIDNSPSIEKVREGLDDLLENKRRNQNNA